MTTCLTEIDARGAELKPTRIRRGQYLGLRFTLRAPVTHTPYDLTGCTARALLRVNDLDVELVATLTGSTIEVVLESTVTATLPAVSLFGLSLLTPAGRRIPLVYGPVYAEAFL